MRRLLVVSLLAPGLACGGLILDRSGLDAVRQALGVVSPDHAAQLFAAGAVESRLVVGPCGEALHAWADFDPAQRETLLAAALSEPWPTCPRACGGDGVVEALAPLEPRERRRTAIQRCDAEGPDPVFGGPLAPLRTGMTALSYLAFRDLLGRAQDHDPRWADLADDVAVSLVLAARPDLSPTDLVAFDGSLTPQRGGVQGAADALRACPSPHLQHRVVVAPGGGVAAVAPDDCVGGVLRGLTFESAGWGWFDVTWTVPPAAAAP